MKKMILTAIAVIPSLLIAQEDFTITGKAGDLNAPAKAYINYRTATGTVLDSANIVNGEFKFHGSVAQPTRGVIVIMHEGEDIRQVQAPDLVELYMEQGHIKIATIDSVANATIEGGIHNQNFNAYKELAKMPTSKMDGVMSKFTAASDELKANPDFMNALQEEVMQIQDEIKLVAFDFIKDHPNSLVSLDLLIPYVDSEPLAEVIEPLFNNLSNPVKNTEAGQFVSGRMEKLKSVDIGAIAPDFAQPDTAGNMVALSSLRGQYVLIDFWASWCGPCRVENPNVVAAYHKFKDKNFTIFGVSLDRPGQKEAWLKAIQDDQLQDWPQVSDLQFWQSPVVEQYAIQGIPQNFLLDPEGRILAKNLRGEELHQVLDQVLNQ